MKKTGYLLVRKKDGLIKVTSPQLSEICTDFLIIKIALHNSENIQTIIDDIEESDLDSLIVDADIYSFDFCLVLFNKIIFKQLKINLIMVYPFNSDGIANYKGYSITCINQIQSLFKNNYLLKNIDFYNNRQKNPESEYSVKENISMQNGLFAFLTGCYPFGLDTTLAKHIGLDEANIDIVFPFDDLFENNNALFVKTPKVSIELFNKIKLKSWTHLVNHIHQITDKEIMFDNKKNSLPIIIQDYSQYFKEENYKDKDYFYFLNIAKEKDLLCFIEDIKLYETRGIIRSFNSSLIDECRWVNSCSLQNFVRYRINSVGEIQPCLTCKKTIFNIKQTTYQKKIAASLKSDQFKIDNQCAKCNIKLFCSKCPMLPESVTSSLYCETNKKHRLIHEYIKSRNILRLLIKSNIIHQNLSTFEFSNFLHPLVADCEQKTPIENYLQKEHNTVLFKVDSSFYFYSYQDGNLISIDKKIAYLAEKQRSDDDNESIIQGFHNKFQIEDASSAVFQGIQLLSDAKIKL